MSSIYTTYSDHVSFNTTLQRTPSFEFMKCGIVSTLITSYRKHAQWKTKVFKIVESWTLWKSLQPGLISIIFFPVTLTVICSLLSLIFLSCIPYDDEFSDEENKFHTVMLHAMELPLLRKQFLLYTWTFVLQPSFKVPVGALMSGKVLSCLLTYLYQNLLSDPGFQRNEAVSTRQTDLCETVQLW